MLKGCQKRVIWVRNPECKWFDEAYFILADTQNTDEKQRKESDMLREANKIIAASPFSGYYGLKPSEVEKNKLTAFTRFKWFLIGFCSSLLCAALACFLI